MRRLMFVLALVAALTFGVAMPAFAQEVPLHQHFLVTPGGERVPIGDIFCENPELFGPGGPASDVFQTFHREVHVPNPSLIEGGPCP